LAIGHQQHLLYQILTDCQAFCPEKLTKINLSVTKLNKLM